MGARSAARADQKARRASDGRAQSDVVQHRSGRGDSPQRDSERAESDHYNRICTRRADRGMHVRATETAGPLAFNYKGDVYSFRLTCAGLIMFGFAPAGTST